LNLPIGAPAFDATTFSKNRERGHIAGFAWGTPRAPTTSGVYPATANNRHAPGTPLSSCSPRSMNSMP
jgi:hypothetical protein